MLPPDDHGDIYRSSDLHQDDHHSNNDDRGDNYRIDHHRCDENDIRDD
jgi:hypothetical protein